MKSIWKFPIGWVGPLTINMPDGAKILDVQAQADKPHIWALVDSDAPIRPRLFHIVGTGHRFPDLPLHYVGTYQLFGGSLVWHVFEEVKE